MNNKFAAGTITNIKITLLDFAKTIDRSELFPTLVPEAANLILSNPYAFCLATCLDRGTKADIIWTIPYWIREILGHLDPFRIYRKSTADLSLLVSQLPKKPRYMDAVPVTILSLTNLIVNRFNGKAEKIWEGRRAADVRKDFLSIYGVGPGIANMALLLIEKGYGVRFSDLDRTSMNIKPDVHTMRVLFRLGVASAIKEDEAIYAARKISPDYPGEVDAPLWIIGRKWCGTYHPLCQQCPMVLVCPKIRIEKL